MGEQLKLMTDMNVGEKQVNLTYVFLPENQENYPCCACKKCIEIFECSMIREIRDCGKGKYFEVRTESSTVLMKEKEANLECKGNTQHRVIRFYRLDEGGHNFGLSPYCGHCRICEEEQCNKYNRHNQCNMEKNKEYIRSETTAKEISREEFLKAKNHLT